MKMHSYITVNGQLQHVAEQADNLYPQLVKATESVGGWDKAIAVASAKQAELDALNSSQYSTPANGSTHEPTPIGTPKVPEGSSTSYVDVKTANALRKRLLTVAAESKVASARGEDVRVPEIHRLASKDYPEPPRMVAQEEISEVLNPHPLIMHPDPQISDMAKDYTELQNELVSSGPTYVKWPENITWKNFVVYQLIPTLVYELEYPRTDRCISSQMSTFQHVFTRVVMSRIRPLYVFEKTVCLTYIIPHSLG